MDTQAQKRITLYLGAVFAGCAAVWLISRLVMPRLSVRAAVGGDQGETQRFMTALAPLVGRESWHIRFRYLPFGDPAAAAGSMDAGGADLLLTRSDTAPERKGRTLVVAGHEAVLLLAPEGSGIDEFADIAGKTVALPEGSLRRQNERLLDSLLEFYSIPAGRVGRITVPRGGIGKAVREKRAAAVFLVGAPGSAQAAEAAAALAKASRGQPETIGFAEAEAIVKKSPEFELLELPRAAISANPTVPYEPVTTVGLSVRLLASADMSDYLASGITRAVIANRPELEEALPGSARLEAPDTEEKAAALPPHPGSTAYFSGDQTSLLDRAEYLLYTAGFIVSAVGYAAAWVLGRRRSAAARSLKGEADKRMGAMLSAVRELPSADEARRARLADELERHADWALDALVAGRIDRERYELVETILSRGRGLLSRAAQK